MADKKFTLLELHLGNGDVQFGPKSISTGDEAAEDELEFDDIDDSEGEASGSSGGKKLLPVVLGLVLLVGLAVVAKKLAGGADLDELEELDELAADD